MTSLEAQYSPSILLPLDIGVTIDLIQPEIYDCFTSEAVHPDDFELFSEPAKPKDYKKTARDYSNSSGYLRKSTLPAGPIAYSHNVQVKEEKVELDIEAEFESANLIPKINAAFEKNEFVHPTKPHLKPEKIYKVLPDEHQLSTEFVVFAYDEEPDNSKDKNVLKEFADDEDTHMLSLYVESKNLEKNSEDEGEADDLEKNKFRFLRNYKYTYLNDPNQNDILMWVDDENLTVSYCMVENKLQLKKKPMPKSHGNVVNGPEKEIRVEYRDETKNELMIRKDKLLELGFQIESGMETPILNSMTDEISDEKNEMLNKLFGSDSESDEKILTENL